MINYTYVFVRMNMLPVQVAVQACHASLELGLLTERSDHPHLLLIGVKDEHELNTVALLLDKEAIEYYQFFEPDMNNSLTALSTSFISADNPVREKLKKYKLLPPFIHER